MQFFMKDGYKIFQKGKFLFSMDRNFVSTKAKNDSQYFNIDFITIK